MRIAITRDHCALEEKIRLTIPFTDHALHKGVFYYAAAELGLSATFTSVRVSSFVS